jgi:hypothetical protein
MKGSAGSSRLPVIVIIITSSQPASHWCLELFLFKFSSTPSISDRFGFIKSVSGKTYPDIEGTSTDVLSSPISPPTR